MMEKSSRHDEPKVAAAAERQMQAWTFAQEIAERIHEQRAAESHLDLGDFITVSREAGAGGGEIAQLVGRKLGWEVLDRNLLDQIAARFHLSKAMLARVDETGANWAQDILGTWLDPKIIPHDKYVTYLSRILHAAARRGKVVFVGRGAAFLLPRERGFAVRVIASEKCRTQYVSRRHGLGETQAREHLRNLEQGRREFVQRFFHRDIADAHEYDLVLNTDRLSQEAAAEAIVAAHRVWKPTAAGRAAPPATGHAADVSE